MRFLALFLVLFLTVSEVAEARSRFGRSMGRRGSRSFFNQKKRPTSNIYKKKAAPRNNSSRSTLNSSRRGRSGGFMKSMMGAVAGTMIGGMLFRALGMNAGSFGSGGGMGLFFPLLLIGGAFLYFRYRKKPQLSNANFGGFSQNQFPDNNHQQQTYESTSTQDVSSEPEEETNELSFATNQDFINERNKDFFSVQHAWSKKNLAPVKDILTSEIYTDLNNEIDEMTKKGHTSTLENLMLTSSQAVSSWNEDQTKFITFKFNASLIEYEADQNGNVVAGKKDAYTDINEFWTFSQSGYGNSWKVSAIENPS